MEKEKNKNHRPWPLSWMLYIILAYIFFQTLYTWWHWANQN